MALTDFERSALTPEIQAQLKPRWGSFLTYGATALVIALFHLDRKKNLVQEVAGRRPMRSSKVSSTKHLDMKGSLIPNWAKAMPAGT